MATRIIEYKASGRGDGLPVVPLQVAAQTPITASGTSQTSAVVSADTSLVCVQSDEAVHVEAGLNPVATASDYKLAAGGEQFFSVAAGYKIAVITA